MTDQTLVQIEDEDEAPTLPGLEIRNLYKIFGPDGASHVEAVRRGLTKGELNRRHGHVLGLTDISLEIPPGKITVIMGLSGSGKSTLIRHINGLIAPTAGEILFDGADVCKMTPTELRAFRRTRTAMVFQKFGLLPHRTVLENTCYGLDIRGMSRSEAEPVARRWIDRVGLKGYEESYPSQLSGGMQQRVGLARALATDADILLMDEAFSALDPLIRLDMQAVLLELQEELHKTIVFITHDLDEALRLGDRDRHPARRAARAGGHGTGHRDAARERLYRGLRARGEPRPRDPHRRGGGAARRRAPRARTAGAARAGRGRAPHDRGGRRPGAGGGPAAAAEGDPDALDPPRGDGPTAGGGAARPPLIDAGCPALGA